jgi:predicted DNA-binding ribbon-helix-helix protein
MLKFHQPGCNQLECAVMKRSIVIAKHKTSVSLEDSFWESLREIATAKGMRLGELVASIDAQRQGNLSSAIRLFVLTYYRELAKGSLPAAEIRTPQTQSGGLLQQPSY